MLPAFQSLISIVSFSGNEPNTVLSLVIDGSDIHIGGVHQQDVKAAWQPLGFFFFSRLLR
jgi:hypothetical protein